MVQKGGEGTINIAVCDAITGVGKTSSAFRYMNENPNRKFLYIAPNLDRTGRIVRECPKLDFVEPKRSPVRIFPYEDDIEQDDDGFRMCTKSEDLIELLEQGRNIYSTHQLFTRMTPAALELIRSMGYTLIVDEALDTFRMEYLSAGDIKMMAAAQAIRFEGEKIVMTPEGDELLRESASLREYWMRLQGQSLFVLKNCNGGKVLYGFWTLRKEMLEAFQEVWMLTYQFRYQELYYYCQIEKIPYYYVGVERDEKGFYFSSTGSYVPDYTKQMKSLIQIVDDKKLNAVGDQRTDLSASYYKSSKRCKTVVLQHSLRAFAERRGVPFGAPEEVEGTDQGTRRMMTVFKSARKNMMIHGWKQSWVPCTQRGIITLRNRDVLAYLINRFMHVYKRQFLVHMGAKVDEEGFALTGMIQWVWRSAIRDGKEIWLYVPSKRMRNLFTNWIGRVTSGQEIQHIQDLKGTT